MVRTSEAINELAKALSAAQHDMAGAKKDALNPHFKSKYADLASVWEACREALTNNGLSVVQFPRLVSGGENVWLVEVETTLLHASGQFMSDTLGVPVTQSNAQGVGSALTYARRYALSAVVGVAPEDDDAESAVRPMGQPPPKAVKPKGFDDWLTDLAAARDLGLESLRSAWTASAEDMRGYLTSTQPQLWDAMKKQAAKVKTEAA